jgi:hypothetical protein
MSAVSWQYGNILVRVHRAAMEIKGNNLGSARPKSLMQNFVIEVPIEFSQECEVDLRVESRDFMRRRKKHAPKKAKIVRRRTRWRMSVTGD